MMSTRKSKKSDMDNSTIGTRSDRRSERTRRRSEDSMSMVSHTSEDVQDDLLALGIKVDTNLIERMSSLGLMKTFEAASQAAQVLRNRKDSNSAQNAPVSTDQGLIVPTQSQLVQRSAVSNNWEKINPVNQVLHE